MFFTQVSQQSKRRLVHLFDCSSNNFRCNAFYFYSCLSDNLINSLFGQFIDICCSFVNNAWSNFTNLIHRVSASIREVVAAEKSSSLSLTSSFFARSFCSSTFLVCTASVACAFSWYIFELKFESLAIARNRQCSPFL